LIEFGAEISVAGCEKIIVENIKRNNIKILRTGRENILQVFGYNLIFGSPPLLPL